jgi:hypothetical protein
MGDDGRELGPGQGLGEDGEERGFALRTSGHWWGWSANPERQVLHVRSHLFNEI